VTEGWRLAPYLCQEIVTPSGQGFVSVALQTRRGERDDDDGRFEKDGVGQLVVSLRLDPGRCGRRAARC